MPLSHGQGWFPQTPPPAQARGEHEWSRESGVGETFLMFQFGPTRHCHGWPGPGQGSPPSPPLPSRCFTGCCPLQGSLEGALLCPHTGPTPARRIAATTVIVLTPRSAAATDVAMSAESSFLGGGCLSAAGCPMPPSVGEPPCLHFTVDPPWPLSLRSHEAPPPALVVQSSHTWHQDSCCTRRGGSPGASSFQSLSWGEDLPPANKGSSFWGLSGPELCSPLSLQLVFFFTQLSRWSHALQKNFSVLFLGAETKWLQSEPDIWTLQPQPPLPLF